jgi:hypothetical protein
MNMPKTFENKQFQFFLQRLTLQLLFHMNLLKMQNSTMTSETLSWCNLDMSQSRCHAESNENVSQHTNMLCCTFNSSGYLTQRWKTSPKMRTANN